MAEGRSTCPIADKSFGDLQPSGMRCFDEQSMRTKSLLSPRAAALSNQDSAPSIETGPLHPKKRRASSSTLGSTSTVTISSVGQARRKHREMMPNPRPITTARLYGQRCFSTVAHISTAYTELPGAENTGSHGQYGQAWSGSMFCLRAEHVAGLHMILFTGRSKIMTRACAVVSVELTNFTWPIPFADALLGNVHRVCSKLGAFATIQARRGPSSKLLI